MNITLCTITGSTYYQVPIDEREEKIRAQRNVLISLREQRSDLENRERIVRENLRRLGAPVVDEFVE